MSEHLDKVEQLLKKRPKPSTELEIHLAEIVLQLYAECRMLRCVVDEHEDIFKRGTRNG